MFKAKISINKKDYYKCNFYYVKKFFSIREVVLVTVLIALSVLLFVLFRQNFIMILCGITLALVIFAMGLYAFTAKVAYKQEYAVKKIAYQTIYFHNDGFFAESFDAEGKLVTKDEHTYQRIDKIAFRKDRIYIYTGVALMYYIKNDALEEGTFEELKTHLLSAVSPDKFKMKTKIKQFPGYSRRRQQADAREKEAEAENAKTRKE